MAGEGAHSLPYPERGASLSKRQFRSAFGLSLRSRTTKGRNTLI